MPAKSYHFDNAVLAAALTNVGFAGVAPYVGLFTVAPANPGDAGTEVVGNAYARVAATFGAPALGVSSNTAPIVFPTADPGGWGTVVAVGIYDQAVGGNLLYYGNLSLAKLVSAGDTVSFAALSLSVTEQ